MSMNPEKLREEIARALYEHWVSECVEDDWAGWELLGDKETWLARADAILAIPSIATALRFTDLHRSAGVVVGDPKIKER